LWMPCAWLASRSFMRLGRYLLAFALVPASASAIGPPPLAKQQVTVQVADFQYRKRRYRGPIYVYRERFTPGQHWQPWPTGRHHRYWHGGVTSVYCHGIISLPEARCYDRDW
jgi:hypothetical protein